MIMMMLEMIMSW